MKRLLREPLLHFLLLGACFFGAYSWMHRGDDDVAGQIVVTQGRIDHLATGFGRTWQRPPTAEELDGLIRDYVREEVFYREALAMGLDRDDMVIRRRLQQKLEFVSEDVVAIPEPTDADLQTYYDAHSEAFRVERAYSFVQVYLNPDHHRDSLDRDAMQLLARLNGADPPDATGVGDGFLLEHRFDAMPASSVEHMFGPAFAARLAAIEPGRWQGPVESGYGTHLVLITDRTEGHVPAFVDVREDVRREWATAARVEANERRYQQLLARYSVTIEQPRTSELSSR